MKKTTIALVSTVFSVSAMADGREGHSWSNWVQLASRANSNHEAEAGETEAGEAHEARRVPISLVPAGTANYAGSTVALVSDSSSGVPVKSVSTGAVNLAVTFNGTGATTETGKITGLTGAGAKIGDLAFSGTGLNRNFRGNVTSAAFPVVAATAATAATGTGIIRGELSRPVVVTPAIAATATTAAVPAVVSAPLSAAGSWGFVATPTLKINGGFITVKQ